jgi:2-dehydropantoate 2-reductase
VKSYQTARAAKHLSMCLADEGIALTLQNGLDNLKILRDALGLERTALGVTTIGATLIEPGRVRNGGDGTINLGAHPRLGPIAELLTVAGFRVQVVADTTSLVWGKLVINAAINPLTALLRVSNGELITRRSTRALMGLVARETATVAASLGIYLPYPDPVEMVESVARRTATNYSSMLKDVLRGSPTEIDSINGAIVQVGDTVQAPVEANRTLWHLVKALEPGQDADQRTDPLHPAYGEASKKQPVSTRPRRVPQPTASN